MFRKCGRAIAGILIMSLLVGCSEGAGGGSQAPSPSVNPVTEKVVMTEMPIPLSGPTTAITSTPAVTITKAPWM